ncbi:MAG TPA: translocation/assembly module TamB domain-containing protein [Abditibacterium sp.]
MPAPRLSSARSRLLRLKKGLPRHKIAQRSGGNAPKNPFFARAGGSAIGGSIPGGRATRGIPILVFGALSILCARWYFGQNLGVSGEVERVLRAQIVPEIEKQLGAKVEIGAVKTDWLGRVEVFDVVIGRNPALPTGALARAKSVTLNLDLPGLALRRATFPDAIRSVTLDAPQIYLKRDKTGLNWANMLPDNEGGPKTAWTGRIAALNGRVYYFDSTVPSASGRPLIVDARGVDATVDALANAPYRFVGRSREPYLGVEKLRLSEMSGDGAVDSDFSRGILGMQSQKVPLAALGNFAFPKRDVILRGGMASGRVQVILRGKVLVPHGNLNFENVAATINSVREPNSTRAAQIDNFTGPVRFAGEAFSTEGAKFRALDADFAVAGAASLGKVGAPPIFDLRIATKALPVARLRGFLPAQTQKIAFSSGPAALSARVAGTTSQMTASGALDAPNVRFSDSTSGARGQFSTLRTVFNAATSGDFKKSLDWRFAARFAAPTGAVSTPNGAIQAANWTGSARGVRNGGADFDLRARDFAVQTPRYGTSRGAALRLTASTPDILRPDWRGNAVLERASTQNLRFAALSPALAKTIRSSGLLSVAAQFSGVDANLSSSKLKTNASFSLSQLQIDERAFAQNGALPIGGDDFNLRAIQGRLALSNGVLAVSRASAISAFGALRLDAAVPLKTPNAARIALSLPQVEVSATRLAPFLRAQNVALDGDWRGRVSLLSRQDGSGKIGFDFDLQTNNSALRGLGKRGARVFLGAPRLRGRADFNAQNPARSWDATATLEAREARVQSGSLGRFAALPDPLSGARAVGLRLNFSGRAGRDLAQTATPRRVIPLDWAGEMHAERFSAPLPIPGRKGVFATLTDARAHLEAARGGIDISRFTARLGRGSLDGTARIENGQPSARILASNVDVATLQRLAAPTTLATARLVGLADATLQIAPGIDPRAQIRLSRGAVSLSPGETIPLDGARAQVLMLPSGQIEVRDALVWSEGARIAGEARLTNAQWSGQVSASGARLQRLASFPFANGLRDAMRPDGLAGGALTFQIDPKNPRNAAISGNVNLKLVSVMGASIDAATAQVEARNGPRGWNFALTNIAGNAESAPFSGEVRADSASNSWRVKLGAQQLESARLTRLGALQNFGGAAPREEVLNRALPVKGVLSGDVELEGTLFDAEGAFAPRPRDGFARVASGQLAWQGRTFGALRADFEVEKGVARAKTLELLRPEGQGDQSTPILSISGQLPLEIGARGLDAKLRVAEAPLAFFADVLREGKDALQKSGVSVPLFERAVTYVDALPAGTTGRVALEGAIQGSWNAPIIRVSSLTLRDGRARVPAGGYSPPAMLDAAFVLEDGAVTIEKAEFRLKKTATPIDSASQNSASTATASEDDEAEDDTLLRVEPGGKVVPNGPISLAADVLNANLSQFSTWVPALRARDGSPLLRGELSEVSFRVGGTTLDPAITGSVQGENLSFSSYTLDRLRVARFEIANGAARIEPGNLTVVKGAFQSSSAYGSVPWSWTPLGPVANAPIDVHFPLQTRDFGALIGVAVPALSVADADEFRGSLDVTGTLQAPQISGAITIRGGQFRLDPRQDAFQTGLTELSGTLRFVGGNQVVVDEEDPLKGRLVAASAVEGRKARREDVRPASPEVKTVATTPLDAVAKTLETKGTSKIDNKDSFKAPRLAGEWVLRGGVSRDLEIDPRAILNPANALARLRYNLSFSLDNGLYESDAFPGVRDVSLGAIWKTGKGRAPENSQNVSWMIAARGTKTRRLKTGGQLTSFGSLTLRPNFATGIDALGRSRANEFSGEKDFAAFPVFKRIDFKGFPDRLAQVRLDDFAVGLTGAASGVMDGRLVLDNRSGTQKAPQEAVRLQQASITGRSAPARLFGVPFNSDEDRTRPRLVQSDFFGDTSGDVEAEESEVPAPRRGGNNVPSTAPNSSETVIETSASTPLRLAGTLTLESAEIYGAPAGGEGAALLLSRLPGAPIFDVRLKMGRDVEIVTAAFRSGLQGFMVASGSPNNPQILGTLQTRDGQVRFPNARARVQEGRVTLALNRDPETDALRTRVEIDATARGQAGRYAITLRLRGPLDLGTGSTQGLKIDVSSNPPLSQNEAFQQLLGTVPTDEGSANQAYASSVLSVLSAPLFSGVEQTIAQTLGLTSVGFEYRFNEPLAVQFTKALGDRVFVSYRRSLGSGSNTGVNAGGASGRTPFELRIEYRIKGDVLVGLQTDERQIPSLTVQKSLRF